MARTVIDLDVHALCEAAEELGTTTREDTVNAALREIAARARRLAFLDALKDSDFGKPDVMREAWKGYMGDATS